MSKEMFLKPTPLYKEFILLSLLAENSKLTQREIAKELEVSVAMVNFYLDKYEELQYIRRNYSSSKMVAYIITAKGEERQKLLEMQFLESTIGIINEAKVTYLSYFKRLSLKYHKVILYGAGDMASLILSILSDANLDLEIVAIIDDNLSKIGKEMFGVKIISICDIKQYDYDAIVISSFTYTDKIISNLQKEANVIKEIFSLTSNEAVGRIGENLDEKICK